MTAAPVKVDSSMSQSNFLASLTYQKHVPKYMRRSNKGSNLLIIAGIAGLIIALALGILVWRAILG